MSETNPRNKAMSLKYKVSNAYRSAECLKASFPSTTPEKCNIHFLFWQLLGQMLTNFNNAFTTAFAVYAAESSTVQLYARYAMHVSLRCEIVNLRYLSNRFLV